MASAFLGYVLPWGQMSFWGATVITRLFGAFPYFGGDLVAWLWGGFAVSNATLTRFFSFHFMAPLLLSGIVLIHLRLLHITGSNNPLGLSSSADKVPFHVYYTVKDALGYVVMSVGLLFVVFFSPFYLGEPDNFIEADPMKTPAHIVPEWYFLFAYAILRAIPNKLGGVIGLFASVAVLLPLPFSFKKTKGMFFSPAGKLFFWMFVLSFFMLSIGGAWPVEEPYVGVSRIFSLLYFTFFVGLLRVV